MNVTIIGAGNMGRGIATRLLKAGNSVLIMDRDDAEAQKLADALRPDIEGDLAVVDAAPMGSPIITDAVVLAVYYSSIPDILARYRDQLANRIVIDITNPLNQTFDDLATPPGSSAAEEIAKQLPSSAKVIKAFNTTFAGTLVQGNVAGESLDVFLAGDDAQAKEQLTEALQGSNLRVIDAGPLRRARQLEGLGLLHITLQKTLGTNWGSAVKILPA